MDKRIISPVFQKIKKYYSYPMMETWGMFLFAPQILCMVQTWLYLCVLVVWVNCSRVGRV